ncbi:hypothetical protein VII00023_02864 [Vibrio ichthyoenteri ATCC 700023]|uniref:Glycine zipper domain-containing protein n=1 Tax=Vibrio ichthyoenteri ATCC 700023 TaxID=870968 RepID=F9S0X4_9VIBR|nr:hypothetical protein [Vibrio ichthyoenteri]EGU42957.1 hypothetical protein VII00023_02864 [Vibrio ichthyoenteri ATCC 700023]
MKFNTKLVLTSLISVPLLAGCVTPGEDDPNAATKQGAVGGALLGLTLGALTGESDLAVKGALAGGVAGGVAGAGQDLQSNRDNIRHDSRNDAIVGIASTGQKNAESQQNWQQLENFVGEWNVNIQNHIVSIDHQQITATGSLKSLSSADVNITSQNGLKLSGAFHYDQANGYQMQIDNQAKGVSVGFVGESLESGNKVSFYPTNVDDVIYADIPSANVRLELSFIGNQVWLIDSYAHVEGKEQKLQTFRFTRIS